MTEGSRAQDWAPDRNEPRMFYSAYLYTRWCEGNRRFGCESYFSPWGPSRSLTGAGWCWLSGVLYDPPVYLAGHALLRPPWNTVPLLLTSGDGNFPVSSLVQSMCQVPWAAVTGAIPWVALEIRPPALQVRQLMTLSVSPVNVLPDSYCPGYPQCKGIKNHTRSYWSLCEIRKCRSTRSIAMVHLWELGTFRL